MTVLDASVIVKWYKTEENSDKAIKIRDEYIEGVLKISVPDLAILELANAIRYKTGSTHQDVLDAVDNFLGLKVNMVPTTDLIKRASENAFNYGITIYDAVYIALAKELGYEFVTADEKLYAKIKDLEYAKLLKEM